MIRILLIAIFVAILICYIKEKISAYSIKALLLKSLTTTLCIMLATYNAFSNPHTDIFAGLVITGLLFGLLGDIWLDLKYVYPADDTIYTYAGFAVFAIGHIFYIIALLRYHNGSPLFIFIPVTAALIAGIANGFMENIMHLSYGSFKRIVMAYGAILFAVMLLAISIAAENHFKCISLNLFAAGGISFAISDLILSGTYFGQGRERPIDLITNYIFYYLAQFLIAMTLMFAA